MVYYGYPLVPPGKPPRETPHLPAIRVPQLFFAGTRDRLSPPDLIASLVDSLPEASLEVVAGGDHSFNVPKASARTRESVMSDLAARTASYLGALS